MKPAAYIIPLDNLFKFCDPETREEKFELVGTCLNIANILECPTKPEDLCKISMFVQDHISDVLALKPYQGKGRVVGEVEGTLNGESFTSDVRMH